MVIATGLLKMAMQSGNVAPHGEYDWMVQQVPVCHMISIENFMEAWFAISTLWLVHFCKTTEKWMTYPMCIWGSFSIIIQSTSTKFVRHIERWSMINSVGLGFSIFFSAAVGLSHKLQVELLVYLNMAYPTPILRRCFPWLFSRPPPNLGGEYSQIVSD